MKKYLAILCAVIFTALAVCGCGNAAASEKYMVDTAAASADYMYNDVMEAPAMAEYAMEEAMPEADYGASMAAGSSSQGAGEVAPTQTGRKLVKNVNLNLETKTFDQTVAEITNKVNALGGYVQSNDIYLPQDENQRGSAYITARIPVNVLDQFVTLVEGAGNVTYKSENVTDITLQYTDTESRKNSLKVEQKRLDDLMAQATNVEDIIAIEQRQSEVRYELESIESQLRTYDNQVDYATVSISIESVVTYTPPEKESFWTRISTGFVDTLKGVGEWLEDAAAWIIISLPALVLIAAFGVIIWLIIRAIIKGSKKRAEKRAAKKAEKEAIKAAKKAEEATKKAEEAAEKARKAEESAEKTEE